MNLSFQIKKSKAEANAKAPIFARITVNGLRTEFSIKRSVEPSKWVSSAGVVKGNTEESKSLRLLLIFQLPH